MFLADLNPLEITQGFQQLFISFKDSEDAPIKPFHWHKHIIPRVINNLRSSEKQRNFSIQPQKT
jgi:hypothetical protein